jgi:hypothetical protein
MGALGASITLRGPLTQRLLPRGENCSFGAVDGVNEVIHALDTVDVARVVSEEDTTKGGKGAHHVRLEGDRSLDAIDIARAGWNCTARHDDDDGGGGVRWEVCIVKIVTNCVKVQVEL